MTFREKLMAWLAIVGFVAGLAIGSAVGRTLLAKQVCEDRTFTDFEILPGNSLRCFSVITLEDE